MSKKLTTEEFIVKARKVHGGDYGYSLVEYVNSHTKVKIICNECGYIFEQKPNSHLSGKGCPVDGGTRRSNVEEFIAKARKVHGEKYDYSLVEYVNAYTKVDIICNKCGQVFPQRPNSHLAGKGCPVDGGTRRSNVEEFIAKAKEVHGEKYDYSQVIYVNNRTKVKIICNKCGHVFLQTPTNHLSGCGCPVDGMVKMVATRRSNAEEFIARDKEAHGDKYDSKLFISSKIKAHLD